MPAPARAERRAAQLDEELPGVRRPALGLREHDARVRDLRRRVVDADSLGARLEQRRARSGSQAVRHMQGCRALESRLHYDDDFALADRNDAERRIAPLHAERMSVLLRVLVRELATDNREPPPRDDTPFRGSNPSTTERRTRTLPRRPPSLRWSPIWTTARSCRPMPGGVRHSSSIAARMIAQPCISNLRSASVHEEARAGGGRGE